MSTWVKPVPNILGTGLRILSLFIFFPHLSMSLRVFVVFLVYIWSLCSPNHLNKARNAFRSLNNVWRSSQYSTKTKPNIYQSYVMSTLLYGSECWRMTESDITKLSVFHTKNLRRILQTFWPDTISNQQLLAWCNKDSMENIIMGRRWRWIGHVMRREQDNITRTALHWIPEGKRKRGRPRNTWRRTMESELRSWPGTNRRGDPS